jgi:hypothetical protein
MLSISVNLLREKQMQNKYLRPFLTLLLVCSACAAVSGVESKKAEDFELPSSTLLVLDYIDGNEEPHGFQQEITSRLSACGIEAQLLPVTIFNHDIAVSREAAKQMIGAEVNRLQIQNVLEVVPALETYVTYYGVKGAQPNSITYMIALKNAAGDTRWAAKMAIHPPGELFSDPAGKILADALVDRMTSDSVLTRCRM